MSKNTFGDDFIGGVKLNLDKLKGGNNNK